MLQLTDISLRRGERLLISGVNLTVHSGQRCGLTGANGCGKSSLFALIRGELEADQGDVSLPTRCVIAHVAQESIASERSALDHVIDGDGELRRLQQQLDQAQQSGDDQRLPQCYEELERIDGFRAEQRAGRLLHGLGFSAEEMRQPLRAFSGGWRMRLNLAQALMCRSDLLLLDEPTNHLDLPAIVWLERWLSQYPGILLVISHDRDFLDGSCTHIAHIEHQQLKTYSGNYSQFENQRAAHLAQQQAQHQRQQQQIKAMSRFVERFRAKASKAKQAQSRLKMLQRMEQIAPVHADSPFHFQFLQPPKLPTHLLSLNDVQAGYRTPDPLVIVDQVKLNLQAGDRIGLLGMNGAGKSTLMKAIADGSTCLQGERLLARDCRIGYFAQHQLEQLQADQSAYDHVRRQDPKLTDQEIRNYLGGFDFHGDRVFEPVAPFSGGEKARLVLALIIQQKPNLLLLDEPTNHLDLAMREALGLALQDYAGALVVIAHDRHLLRSVCDDLYIVHNGDCQPFSDDLDAYPDWLFAQLQAPGVDDEPNKPAKSVNKKAQRQQEAAQRRQLKPYTDRIRKAEQALETMRQRQHQLAEILSDSDLYNDSNRQDEITALLKEQAELQTAIEEQELEWLDASEAYETAVAETT
ncbi:MAG: ATP-binding cassette domain-containing protein [Wenzhouxiangellaceae bacterium]